MNSDGKGEREISSNEESGREELAKKTRREKDRRGEKILNNGYIIQTNFHHHVLFKLSLAADEPGN